MVNTRAKTRKIQNTFKNSFLKAATEDFDHQSTESGAEIGTIDDLLIEILHRLPATSVFQFKSVSKHWESLLAEESFTLRFDKLLRSPGLFVHNSYVPFDVEDQSPPPFRNLDFCLDIYGIRIMQSCNGLMLCCSDRAGLQYARKYYVFNPTTKKFAIIPPVPGGRAARNGVRFMGLAFHQTNCPHYKVVCIHYLLKSDWQKVHIQIYSSETRRWKFTNESFSPTQFTYGVYWNGTFLWAPCSLTPLCFNLDVEQLQKLPLPSPLPSRFTSSSRYRHVEQPLYFGESRGHLHMVETAPGGNYLHLNVYEMMIDRSQWFVKYQVELDELPALYPEMISDYDLAVYDVVRGDKEDDTFMVVAIPGGIIRYNIMNKCFKQIFDLPRSQYYRIIKDLHAHRYTEALTKF